MALDIPVAHFFQEIKNKINNLLEKFEKV